MIPEMTGWSRGADFIHHAAGRDPRRSFLFDRVTLTRDRAALSVRGQNSGVPTCEDQHVIDEQPQ